MGARYILFLSGILIRNYANFKKIVDSPMSADL
jgi:hypothetical protein